jgi:hypothetical protein
MQDKLSPGLVGESAPVLLVVALLPHRLDVGQRQVDLQVLQLVVLVQAALAAVGLRAALHAALVVPLNFVGVPAHALPLLGVALALTAELVVLVLAEPVGQLSLLIEQLLDLVGQRDVGQEKPAVLVVVAFLLRRIAE